MLIENIRDGLGDKDPKYRILVYICEHTDTETFEFSRTYSRIRKDLKVSDRDITETLQTLVNIGSLTRIGQSRYKNNLIAEVTDNYNDDTDNDQFLYYVEAKGR